LRRKIEAASKYVPLENLSLSPQCGFASHQHCSGLTFEQQEAKLKLVIETAREVWGTT
jgi:5-methyltetrahydropteroyltriglutamate--homocysteine methyltransferase